MQTDILINGAGAAGLTLAILLGQMGIEVALIDPYPPQSLKQTPLSTRTVALMDSSLNILKATGIWEKLKPFSAPLETMRIIDDSARTRKNIEIEFPASDIGKNAYGYNIPGSLLRAALYERAQELENITLHIPGTLENYELKGQSIKAVLENKAKAQNTAITAKLIIGADGRNSLVRRIAGIKTKRHDYDQHAITCLINHSRSHNNSSTEFHRPAGPLALVPLPGNCSSVVWVETPKRADELLSMSDNHFIQALQEEIGSELLGGITLEKKPESWPLSCIKAKALTAPRTALIAEAAHVISPITAQGLNLSLRDVAALAETLVDALRLGLDPGSAVILNKYRRRRLGDINSRVFGVDRLNRIVSTNFEPLKGLRRKGLRTLELIPPFKTLAMHQGLAPQTDLGRLAKGETL